ncbi:RIP metalloprotease RseP [Mycoplasmatota bacterium]|nr:RIP metalloprotease RseP [Mycoplasmatota bacterium]
MSFLLYFIIFIFVLGIIVLIHEFGHFLFARRAGILCHEFSIGMGPALYKIKRGETTYAIRAIPLGGYVSMAGEDPETEKIKKGKVVYLEMVGNAVKNIYLYKPQDVKVTYAKVIDFDLYGKEGNNLYIHYEGESGETHFVTVARDAYYQLNKGLEMQIAPYDRCFESKSWINRFLTVVAGAGFNFILAIIVFIVVNLTTGVAVTQPIIGSVSDNSPAELVGLQENDEIVKMAIDDEVAISIDSWDDISTFMRNYENGVIKITVKRDGELLPAPLEVRPELFIATIGIKSTNNLSNTIIGGVSLNSNADKEGLKSGDEIIKISGTLNDDKNTKQVENTFIEASKANNDLNNWTDISNVLENFYLSEKINITVLRDGTTHTFTVQSIKALESANVTQAMVGITHKTEFNFFKSIGYGVKDTLNVIGSIFQTLDMLFNNKNVSIRDLSGPVGIYDMTKTFAMAGFIALLSWVGFISANIGFVNLLPLPALDGGRLLFLLIEGIVRRPINRKIEGYIHTVGFILFMLLFLFITFNDIIRIRG